MKHLFLRKEMHSSGWNYLPPKVKGSRSEEVGANLEICPRFSLATVLPWNLCIIWNNLNVLMVGLRVQHLLERGTCPSARDSSGSWLVYRDYHHTVRQSQSLLFWQAVLLVHAFRDIYSGGLNTEHIGIPNVLKFGFPVVRFCNGQS